MKAASKGLTGIHQTGRLGRGFDSRRLHSPCKWGFPVGLFHRRFLVRRAVSRSPEGAGARSALQRLARRDEAGEGPLVPQQTSPGRDRVSLARIRHMDTVALSAIARRSHALGRRLPLQRRRPCGRGADAHSSHRGASLRTAHIQRRAQLWWKSRSALHSNGNGPLRLHRAILSDSRGLTWGISSRSPMPYLPELPSYDGAHPICGRPFTVDPRGGAVRKYRPPRRPLGPRKHQEPDDVRSIGRERASWVDPYGVKDVPHLG